MSLQCMLQWNVPHMNPFKRDFLGSMLQVTYLLFTLKMER